MTEPIPQQVKKEVAKELGKKDFSWIRRDWVVIGVLFVVLAVISTVQIISLNRIEDTLRHSIESVDQTDIIAECFTPGTRCSKFRAESDEEERKFFASLMKNTALCTLLTSRQARTIDDPVMLDQIYQTCVDTRVGPPPEGSVLNPPNTTSSTTR